MGLPKELSSIKRFGVRYGRTTRHRYAIQDRLQKQIYKCPYCAKQKVKRVSVGLWCCRKCGAFFTGKAYTLAKKRITAEELVSQFLPGEQTVQASQSKQAEVSAASAENASQPDSASASPADTAPSKPKKEKKPRKSKKEQTTDEAEA
ncbi:TPA: hypothetical protein HA249_03910 [Candidatus Woesearchaeota archaeon]|nr:hypothetical protein [Candidatus Woesearchaeota archaeon]HII88356.1 hypothetical protein [Candidatus Woesearchaeota archaeon]